ncbi:MAG: hypothetical protein RIS88_2466 [Pseudomonadota bacterium]|jgi:hypothetical protein
MNIQPSSRAAKRPRDASPEPDLQGTTAPPATTALHTRKVRFTKDVKSEGLQAPTPVRPPLTASRPTLSLSSSSFDLDDGFRLPESVAQLEGVQATDAPQATEPPQAAEAPDESNHAVHGNIVLFKASQDGETLRAAFVDMRDALLGAWDPDEPDVQSLPALPPETPAPDMLLIDAQSGVQGLYTRDVASCVALCLHHPESGCIGMAHRSDSLALADSTRDLVAAFEARTGHANPRLVVAFGTDAYRRDLLDQSYRDPHGFIAGYLLAGNPLAKRIQDELARLGPDAFLDAHVNTVVSQVVHQHACEILDQVRRLGLPAVHLPHSCVMLGLDGQLETFSGLQGPPALVRARQPRED